MRRLPLLVLLAVALAFAGGCTKERKVDVAASLNPAVMPTMKTVNVSTLISDSGIIQYKIVAPVWYVYDLADTPYWKFPQGLYLRKYDRQFRVIASVAADSARYFKNQRIWRLDGNVEMHKEPRDLFLTEQLFWNERERRIYSDSFIHIENATHQIEGYGFVSDDRLTTYTIKRPTGIFPVNRENMRPGASGNDGGQAVASMPDSAAKPDRQAVPVQHASKAMPAAPGGGAHKKLLTPVKRGSRKTPIPK